MVRYATATGGRTWNGHDWDIALNAMTELLSKEGTLKCYSDAAKELGRGNVMRHDAHGEFEVDGDLIRRKLQELWSDADYARSSASYPYPSEQRLMPGGPHNRNSRSGTGEIRWSASPRRRTTTSSSTSAISSRRWRW